MTEKEATKVLAVYILQLEHSLAEGECEEYNEKEMAEAKRKDEQTLGALNMAIKAMEEIQQYREIGTVEECRAARERRTQRRALRRKCSKCDKDCDGLCEDYTDRCPECKKVIYNEHGVTYAYCPNCGQALDWSEEE